MGQHDPLRLGVRGVLDGDRADPGEADGGDGGGAGRLLLHRVLGAVRLHLLEPDDLEAEGGGLLHDPRLHVLDGDDDLEAGRGGVEDVGDVVFVVGDDQSECWDM